MGKVAIVIVNYKTAKLATECIEAMVSPPNADLSNLVKLIDNASPDDSAETLERVICQKRWSNSVELFRAPRNGGFAYGNNLGIQRTLNSESPPDYVLLLNPDTLVHPRAVEELSAFLDEHPHVGIVGSRLENPDSSPQISAFRFPSILSEIDAGLRMGWISRILHCLVVAPPVQTQPHPTDWVAGASMLIRREVIDQIGLLDEGYFMYYEEVDFCKRARQAGWECWYVPQSRVIHLVGQASGINSADTKPKRRPDYVFESRRRYFQKHHGRFYAILADLAWLTTYPLWRLRRWIQRKPDTDPPRLWWDTFRHSSLWHGIDS